MGKKRKRKAPEEDNPPVDDGVEDMFEFDPFVHQGQELYERLQDVGVTGADEAQIAFFRREGSSTKYIDSAPLSSMATMVDEAKERWGPGKYLWRLKIGNRWAKKGEWPGIPLSGTFEIDGQLVEPKDDDVPVQNGVQTYKEGFKESLGMIKEIVGSQDKGAGLNEIANVMGSVVESARTSIETVQRQAEQNVKTVLETSKANMETILETLKSERELYRDMMGQQMSLLNSQMEREREMYGVIIDLTRGQDRGLAERVLDRLGDMFDAAKQGQPSETKPDGTEPEKPSEEGSALKTMQNILKVLEFCRKNKVVPEECAKTLLAEMNEQERLFLQNSLKSLGVEGTIKAAEQAAAALNFVITKPLRTYAEKVLEAANVVCSGKAGS